MTLLFIATWTGTGVAPPVVVQYDALRGSITMGPRLDGTVSAEQRLSGQVIILPA